MGQAWRAPDATYVRNYQIATHAVGRLRERIADATTATFRSDEDLANCIDAAVTASVQSHRVEEIIDDGEATKLVDLTDTLNDSLFALLKQNKRSGPREVVLTLLTSEMVETNRKSKRWVRPYIRLGTLADVFKGVTPSIVNTMPPTPKSSVELRMITYHTLSGTGPQCVQYEKALIAEKIAELRRDPNVRADTVELWKPVVFKAREVIDLEE